MKQFLLIVGFLSLFSCKTQQFLHTSSPGNELFKIAILYPSGEGKTFDMDYYESKHMPMVEELLGNNLQFYEIDKGIAGRTPTDTAPYLAVGNFYVKDLAEYNKVIGQHREAIVSDFKNYTNVQPIILISEIKKIGYAKTRHIDVE
jgi:uncharacterized protein (TIGR02118 family)